MLKHAPHKQAAVQFLEYLSGNEAQIYFADGNNEWPVAQNVATNNPALKAMGTFKAETLDIATIGRNQPTAQKIFDRIGLR